MESFKNYIIFSVTLLILIFIPKNVFAHTDTAYWNSGKITESREIWMRVLPDNKKLCELSLPGTHDSMAWQSDLLGLDSTRTQTMSLKDQLLSGIRVIDIRAKYNKNSFPIHHGIAYLRADLDDVLKTVKEFLEANPSETVLIRFSQEYSSASDTEMKLLFDKYYNKFKSIFYQGSSRNPKLGDVRGKLILLSNVTSLNQYGIPYRSLNIQDDYHLNTNWDLYSKWEKVKRQINNSNNRDGDTIYMNYLSGSGGSFPYFVASGHSSPGTSAGRLATGLTEPAFRDKYPDFPRVGRVGSLATICFEGTNTLTADYLYKNRISYCGIVMADFPGARLINNIIECNFL